MKILFFFFRLDSELRDMEIGVLVNNVGMMSSWPDFYLNQGGDPKVDPNLDNDLDRGLWVPRSMVNCNINSMNAMTR